MLNVPLDSTYPEIPGAGNTQVRIFSGIPGCNYRVSTNIGAGKRFILRGIDFYSSGNVETNLGIFELDYTIENLTNGCPPIEGGTQLLNEATAYTLFLRPVQKTLSKLWYEDELQKSNKSKALIRTLANLAPTTRILWRDVKSGNTALDVLARHHDLHELSTIEYAVLQGDSLIHQQCLRPGGVYALVIGQDNQGFVSRMFEVTEPNSMSMLWLIPQYVVMTLGEVMFSVTGLEFSYSQAPASMKSLLQAFWLLTVAFGNIIVVVVAELKFFRSQASEFFLFAGLMFVDMLIFMWFACYYKPYEEVATLKRQRNKLN
ncbi:solute carrier family 15 member 2-like [Drosophila innubila]|uniref:solute carrier family 15 member 2-like n=1 Tax=Drosophila innubila TaxID=198719 RepID=UPI00148CA1F4|nr:solute carrier family 15 member 2-like [Drosophila innubila]